MKYETLHTAGQVGKDRTGTVIVVGGRIAWNEDEGAWGYVPGSETSEDIQRLNNFFSELEPGAGPVDVILSVTKI